MKFLLIFIFIQVNLLLSNSLTNISNISNIANNISDNTSNKSTSTNISYYQEPVVVDRSNDNQYLILWIKLFVVMGTFCGAAYFLFRFIKKKNIYNNQNHSELFDSLAEFTIGINKKIQIIKIINEFYLLSVTQDQISLLGKIDDKESIDLLSLQTDKSKAKDNSFFQDVFKNYINTGGWSPLTVTKNLKEKVRKF